MKLKELHENNKTKQGTYAGVRYSNESVTAITKYIKDNNIPNPVATHKMHTTLLYSRKFLPKYKPQGKLTPPLKATFDSFVVWETTPPDPTQEPWNCLVMKLKCPALVELHKKYMKEHQATYDYDEYSPHITLSYNIGDLDVGRLPNFDVVLEIVEEYGEDLELDWAETKGVTK